MVLHLPIGPLKNRSELEPVPRCEPSTYQPHASSGPVFCYAHFVLVKRTYLGAFSMLVSIVSSLAMSAAITVFKP